MALDRILNACVLLLLLCLPSAARCGEAAGIEAEEKLSAGLALLHDKKDEEALPLLAASVTGLEGAERRTALHRIIGCLLSDKATASSSRSDRDDLFDAASEHFRLASTDGDRLARRHYLSLEARRSPERGYAAGWQYLDWNGPLAIDGWLVVVGNYGAVVTGGKGLNGLIDKHPMHAVVWASLIVLLLIFAFVAWRHGRHDVPETARRPVPTDDDDARASGRVRTPQPAKRSSAANHPAARRRPSSSDHLPATRTPRPPAPIPSAKPLHPTPKPDLDRLRMQHRQLASASPEKNETELYEKPDARQSGLGRDDTDPGSPLVRKSPPSRDETEPGGLPLLPPGGRPPLPPPPRRPR